MKLKIRLFSLLAGLALIAPLAGAQATATWTPATGTPTYTFGISAPGTFAACIPIPAFASSLNLRVSDAGITSTYTVGIYTATSCSGSFNLCGSTVTVASGASSTATCTLSGGGIYAEVKATGGSGQANAALTATSSIAGINALLLGGYAVNFSSPVAGQCAKFATSGSGLAIQNLDCLGHVSLDYFGTYTAVSSYSVSPTFPVAATVTAATLSVSALAAGCTTYPVVVLYSCTGTYPTCTSTTIGSVTLSSSSGFTPMTISPSAIPAGGWLLARVNTAGVGCSTNANGGNLIVQYY